MRPTVNENHLTFENILSPKCYTLTYQKDSKENGFGSEVVFREYMLKRQSEKFSLNEFLFQTEQITSRFTVSKYSQIKQLVDQAHAGNQTQEYILTKAQHKRKFKLACYKDYIVQQYASKAESKHCTRTLRKLHPGNKNSGICKQNPYFLIINGYF